MLGFATMCHPRTISGGKNFKSDEAAQSSILGFVQIEGPRFGFQRGFSRI